VQDNPKNANQTHCPSASAQHIGNRRADPSTRPYAANPGTKQ